MSVKAQYLQEFISVFVIYTLSSYCVDYFIMPIQTIHLPNVSEHCCLLFIPHAVRVLTIWLYGARGLLYLLVVAQFSYYVVYDNHPTSYLHFLSPFVAPVAVFTWFEFFKRFGSDPYHIGNWKILILIGVLSSITNGFILGVIYGFQENALLITLYYAIGDFNGVLLILLLMMGYFKLERIFSKNNSI